MIIIMEKKQPQPSYQSSKWTFYGFHETKLRIYTKSSWKARYSVLQSIEIILKHLSLWPLHYHISLTAHNCFLNVWAKSISGSSFSKAVPQWSCMFAANCFTMVSLGITVVIKLLQVINIHWLPTICPQNHMCSAASNITASETICFPSRQSTTNAGITFKGEFKALVTNWAFWEQENSSQTWAFTVVVFFFTKLPTFKN